MFNSSLELELKPRRRSRETEHSEHGGGSLEELLASFSSNDAVRGRQFEILSKWLLQNAPMYRTQVKQVWDWRDWPGRWGNQDLGIDLVAETHEGKLWAVQCKCHRPQNQLKKREIDSFLSESSRDVFSYRLLIATTDLLGSNAERTIEGQEKPVGLLLRSEIDRLGLQFPKSLRELSGAQPIPQKFPLPHQEKAIADVCGGLAHHGRGQLLTACGTGKTLDALWIAERLKARSVLLATPSLGLLAQALKEWCEQSSSPFRYIVVCSDKTVIGNESERVVESAHDLGVPVTTDFAEVQRFLGAQGDERLVVFSTYQSLDVVSRAQRASSHSFDLGIADEAHYCAGSGKGLFSKILHECEVRIDSRLFMTATPKIYTAPARARIEELGLCCADMDDEKLFGPVLHRLPLGDAIKQNLLCDYRVVVLGVREQEVLNLLDKELYFLTDKGRRVDACTLGAQIALLKAANQYGVRKVITFHNSVARAKDFSESLEEVLSPLVDSAAFPIWSSHINGSQRTSNRVRILDMFRAPRARGLEVVSNCDCLGQGIDVPLLDCVAFVDPRTSPIDLVQNVGRVVRKSPGKEVGTILIPVFVREGEDAQSLLASSRFAPVYQVLRALRSHDPQLAAALDASRSSRQQGGLVFKDPYVAERLLIDLDKDIPARVSQSIYLRLVESAALKPPLSEEKILEWAKVWKEKHGVWPSAQSGHLGEIAESESETTWQSINAALKCGVRGLPGGTTLALLLEEHGLRVHPSRRNALSEDQIVFWAKAWNKKYGRWPKVQSGKLGDLAPGEENVTWLAIHDALRVGLRGLPGSSSLAELLRKHGLKRNHRNLPVLTEEKIVRWAKAWRKRHGNWPKVKSGVIGDVVPSERETTWCGIDLALSQGLRGLSGGSTLARLLAEQGLKRNGKGLAALSEAQILLWAKAWRKKHGQWPTKMSGPLGNIAPEERETNWGSINTALIQGLRNLPGRSSLCQLLEQHALKRSHLNRPDLSEAQILCWAKAWKKRYGGWPTIESGMLGAIASSDNSDTTWSAVNSALAAGSRGLPGGSSLCELLAKHGLKRNRMKLPALSEKQILAWAESWKARHGALPFLTSGKLGEVAPEERETTWAAINAALSLGARGLPGGSSLSRLIKTSGKEQYA